MIEFLLQNFTQWLAYTSGLITGSEPGYQREYRAPEGRQISGKDIKRWDCERDTPHSNIVILAGKSKYRVRTPAVYERCICKPGRANVSGSCEI
uniref:Uncharacterized protein n=1 Tax=Hyaloperonospora arabidopsidis (strain Emoy2) TaxID=559515 RepID=M4C0Q3_HYAAE